jgi:glutamyl/glutaminyl-tRNA synthetase
VVRGDDHISNTPKHVLLFEAFGAAVPQFAHVRSSLAPTRSASSKRHGATSVMEYPRLGYLPEAMVNFLALLGWSPAGPSEGLFTVAQLIDRFSPRASAGAMPSSTRRSWTGSTSST